MRQATVGLVAMLTLAGAAVAQEDDFWKESLRSAQRSLLRGKLAAAQEGFELVVESFEEDPADDRPDVVIARLARQGLLELGMNRGEYAEVHDTLLALPARERDDRGYRTLLARVLQARGEYAQMLATWSKLVEARPDDVAARFWQGWVLRETGDLEAARAAWQAAVDVDAADALSMTYAGRSLVELGGADNMERASALFTRAYRLDPDRSTARTHFGLLKFTVYGEAKGYPSGERDLQAVLREHGEVEEALVGLYRLRSANFQLDPSKTEDYLSRALSLNPNSVPALMERGIALLHDRRFDGAAQVLARALEVNPNHKWVLAHRAAVAMLLGDRAEEARFRKRALDVDQGFAEMDRVYGDHLVRLYRFADALPYYGRAREADPESVPALHGMAKALVYVGRGAESLKLLQRAAELQKGFVSPWRGNAIAVEELLGQEYRVVEHDGLRLKLHHDDRDVLEQYLAPIYQQAKAELGEKYGYKPVAAVTVEVFHTWADFSVRTIGFRGFSALGACFGRFITLVSPSDVTLRQQDFMWAATVWHEYTHVLTLALSKHRVPRWLTEGFSVYEERQKNRAWERGMTRELFDAYHNREIVPLLRLNRLFRGPRILFGYYQGGLIVDYLSREYGFEKVLELLRGYGEDRSTKELFASVFGLDTEAFDRRFIAHVKQVELRGLRLVPRFSDHSMDRLRTRLAADPDDVDGWVDLGWAHVQRGNLIDAASTLREALRRAPRHGRGLLLHAELLRRRDAVAESAERFRAGFAEGADDFDSRVRFGRLLEKQGDAEAAMEQYQRAKACWPHCTDQQVAPNLLLARLLRELGRDSEALMELKSYVSRTGRAFRPRLELAALERQNGNHAEAVRLLEEAVWIDPFMRELHVRLGGALVALGKRQRALREFQVALAVRPPMDRAYLGRSSAEIPDPDSAGERETRAAICVRIARLRYALDQRSEAFNYLERAIAESRGGAAAGVAADLLAKWNK